MREVAIVYFKPTLRHLPSVIQETYTPSILVSWCFFGGGGW